ncbi:MULTISPECIES: dihydrofolate reductase [Wolbachia]|uniref:dihydrofolate reductase n=1 Tax=Wolbachia pipientis TaxID=955 RepID=A0A7G5CC51_WOLPI|nr:MULTISPECIES: dihydrofolate reductase [Wolbachia]MDE5061029.1 dihydrofolate reductase [Wolbachia endosymbiont of Drosophila nikananu]MDE5062606.1 dihydrofolate reductase [Wolbachia endosymbiont of Drosophila tsacasi]QMV46785.1 dihydrofolate reductase [Wolbachia pipientis]
MKIIGIMAVDPKGVIGINNGLPWHYPSELDHFRQVTDKQVIVMGRKTFEIIPQNILKNRIPVVFSRNKLSSCFNRGIKCTIISSMQEFLSIQGSSKVFVIGGAQIAHLFLKYDLISEFIITEIHRPYEGDVYFNLTLLDRWNKTILTKTKDYTICKLTR